MTEPQDTQSTETEAAPVAVEVEADQAVVNTAPDGGGIDNNEGGE